MNTIQSRREFVKIMGRALLALNAGLLIGSSTLRASDSVTSRLKNIKIKRRAGEIYLEQYPEENDFDDLVYKIFKEDMQSMERSSEKKITDRLCEAIRLDFENGNVINLMRWRLSRTEGRYFAMQTLIATNLSH